MPNRVSSPIGGFRARAGSSAAALAALPAGLAAALRLAGSARARAGAREVARAAAAALGAQDAIAHEACGRALQALGVLAQRGADLLEAQAGVRGDVGLQIGGGLHARGRGLAAAAAGRARGGGGGRAAGPAAGARSRRGVALDRLAQRIE